MRAGADSARLRGDLGVSKLRWALVPADVPVAAELHFDYTLDRAQVLRVHRQELRLPQLGLRLTLQGELAGLADFLVRRRPWSLSTAMRKVSARLTATQHFAPAVDARPVLPGLAFQGTVQNEVVFTMLPGQGLRLTGALQIHDVSATYPPSIRVAGLQVTLPSR